MISRSNPASKEPAWLDQVLDRPAVLIAYLALHGAIGVAMRGVPGFSKTHALLTLLLGLAFCLYRRHQLHWVYLAGYIIAAEVLWKMTRGAILWEQGKYFFILVLVLGVFTTRKMGNPVAAVQLLLLLPSAVMTCFVLPLAIARDALSFNLSGPLGLCVATVFLSSLQISTRQLCKLFLVMAGPTCAIAVVILFNMSAIPAEVEFRNSSNYFITGGFGPNQVSAALGLGIFQCMFLILAGQMPFVSRTALGAALVLLIAESALTFSRNGLYCGLGASVVAAPFLLTDSKSRNRFLVAVPVVALIFFLLVLPRLDNFTGGQLSRRFEQTSSSGRDEILSGELELWKENPIFGVGPGVAKYARGDVWEAAAHTEYSRLVAEHGTLGLAALLLYPIMFFVAFQSAQTRIAKALVVGAMAWSFSFMLVNAMRMAAPSFMFGLACTHIREVTPRRRSVTKRRSAEPFHVSAPAGASVHLRT